MRIGIDIGGVIIDRANDDEDTSLFGPNYLTARPVAGAIEALRMLNTEIFPGEVYIVSKCGEKIEMRSREWLKANQVHEKTGISESKLSFCRDRSEKAPIARKLGLTHFVDDRLEVLGYMRGIVAHRILFAPSPGGLLRHGLTSGPVVLAFSWKDVLDWLTSRPKDASAGSCIETLKNFFIGRQEFDYAKAVVDLGRIYLDEREWTEEPFVTAERARQDLLEEQRVDVASMLADLLRIARIAVESGEQS